MAYSAVNGAANLMALCKLESTTTMVGDELPPPRGNFNCAEMSNAFDTTQSLSSDASPPTHMTRSPGRSAVPAHEMVLVTPDTNTAALPVDPTAPVTCATSRCTEGYNLNGRPPNW